MDSLGYFEVVHDNIGLQKHEYNYILMSQKENIKQMGLLSYMTGVEPEEEIFHIKRMNNMDIDDWEAFIQLCHSVMETVTVDTLQVSALQQQANIHNVLQNKFMCICTEVSDNTIDIMCAEDEMTQIKKFIEDNTSSNALQAISIEYVIPVCNTSGSDKTQGLSTGYDIGGICQIYIHIADITMMSVDAIVNAANGHLHHGGGVAHSISHHAGSDLQDECRNIIKTEPELKVASVVSTTAGNLPSKRVFHAVGPRWPRFDNKNEQKICVEKLTETFKNVFLSVAIEGIHSMALPPISSGIFKVPHEKVADSMFKGLAQACDTLQRRENKEGLEIHLVDITDGLLKLVDEKFKSYSDADNIRIEPIPNQKVEEVITSRYAPRKTPTKSPEGPWQRFKRQLNLSTTAVTDG